MALSLSPPPHLQHTNNQWNTYTSQDQPWVVDVLLTGTALEEGEKKTEAGYLQEMFEGISITRLMLYKSCSSLLPLLFLSTLLSLPSSFFFSLWCTYWSRWSHRKTLLGLHYWKQTLQSCTIPQGSNCTVSSTKQNTHRKREKSAVIEYMQLQNVLQDQAENELVLREKTHNTQERGCR